MIKKIKIPIDTIIPYNNFFVNSRFVKFLTLFCRKTYIKMQYKPHIL